MTVAWGRADGFIEGSNDRFSEGTVEGVPEGWTDSLNEGHYEGLADGTSEGLMVGIWDGFIEGFDEAGLVDKTLEGLVEGASLDGFMKSCGSLGDDLFNGKLEGCS